MEERQTRTDAACITAARTTLAVLDRVPQRLHPASQSVEKQQVIRIADTPRQA
jgi:hypothetical protein